MDIRIDIPKEVEIVLNILNKNDYEAFVVGGCVRDSLLGKVPHDWDVTTSAKPEEIIECFKNYRTINTGLKHGTVTVIINHSQIEITTYRIDGEYSDNRRPDCVIFTDKVYHDLKRRDFTINALAYNKNGVVDLFDGINDLNKKVIKCVGNPNERFNEDGLRILRALRFASVLNFTIDKDTAKSIYENKELLNNISRERINIEFNKLVTGINFYNIMKAYKEVFQVFIPSIGELEEKRWNNILNSMNYADDLVIKLSLLLENTDVEKVLKELKYDGVTIKKVKAIALYKDIEILPDKIKIKKQLSEIGYENYANIIKYKVAKYKSEPIKYEQNLININKATKVLEYIINNNNECFNLKGLALNGNDLIELGFRKGVALGSTLNEVLNLVIEGKLENNKESLIKYVKEKNHLDKSIN